MIERQDLELLACVELGGSGSQTVLFDGHHVQIHHGVVVPPNASLAMAVPGHIVNGRVARAATIGWDDVDPAHALGLQQRPLVVCNDAEAAAVGEWALRYHPPQRLLYVGMGTGIGGALVHGGEAVATNLLGHQSGFGSEMCVCGMVGCLETVASGWALPSPVPYETMTSVATAIATAIERESLADQADIVVAGGLVRGCPRLVELLAEALPSRAVLTSDRPATAKSAAAWGLRHALRRALRSNR